MGRRLNQKLPLFPLEPQRIDHPTGLMFPSWVTHLGGFLGTWNPWGLAFRVSQVPLVGL